MNINIEITYLIILQYKISMWYPCEVNKNIPLVLFLPKNIFILMIPFQDYLSIFKITVWKYSNINIELYYFNINGYKEFFKI